MAVTLGKVFAVRDLDYVGWFGSAKRFAAGDRLPCVGLEEDGDLVHLLARSPAAHQNIHHVYSAPKGAVRIEPDAE